MKPALINKAIKVAKNMDWDKHQDEFEDLAYRCYKNIFKYLISSGVGFKI